MKHIVRDRIAHVKHMLRPHAVWGLGHLPVTARYSGRGHILMFHRVVPLEEMSQFGMSAFEITPQTLEMSINFFLERGYRVVSLDEMCDSLISDTDSSKFIVLTFDDGYKDTLTHAYPVLRAYDAPFTVNITVGYAERAAIKWDYLAEDVIHSHDTVAIDTCRGRVELDCSTPASKKQSCGMLQDILYEMSGFESSDGMKTFFSSYFRDVYHKTDELMLDWPQIEELARDPLVTIGAHSINHRVLSRLTRSVAEHEILCSRTMLESRLGVEVSHFAYPYGRLHEAGEREYETARQCGFRTGSTGIKGNIFSEHARHFVSLPRFCLGSNCTEGYLRTIANGSLPFLSNGFRRLPAPHETQTTRDQG